MFKKKSFFFFLLVSTLSNAQINSLIESWKNHKDLKNASIGFCVLDAKTDETISEFNAHQFLIPASTLKVITTSAALGILGNNFKYETKILYRGNFNKASGTLNGDIIIVGSGDPTLQSENFVKDSSNITTKWAQILKEKGLKKITGSIIADASCFERTVPDNWIWADISNYFGAIPCGLSFMDNKFKVIYTSKENGSVATVVNTIPSYLNASITINSSVVAKGFEDNAIVYGDPFSYTKQVSGKIPPNKKSFEVEAVLPDPALLCAEMLYTSLTKVGIACNQKLIQSHYKKNDSLASAQLLYTHFSPTLDKIILHTNMKSNNHYCESILLTLGKGSIYNGIEAVKNYWQKQGLDKSELFMTDGSGLSRANTTTTFYQANVLSKLFKDSLHYKVFNASLPIAGKNGSMSNIGKATFIENNMRAKTGYINRVRSYCGYVTSQSGKNLAFSIIFNNYNCSAKDAKNEIEKFLIELGKL
jgi:serine-type D-Ala-D-Ala carboxypeptidase/endopeptidase (penicillin-binding protein 4)